MASSPITNTSACGEAWQEIENHSADAWSRRCVSCGFLASNLQPVVREVGLKAGIQEAKREEPLRELRTGNFHIVLDRIEGFANLPLTKVLGVGCAHGWFLEEASRRGASALGIEPDEEVAATVLSRGLSVRVGFFPEALAQDERCGVIAFNDVLEHLPNLEDIVGAIVRHLDEGGLVSINLPLSTGFFFRLASWLDRLGLDSPIRRMWQEGLPSPHLSYFSQEQLKTLFERYGLEEVHRSTLPTLGSSGLWDRISHTTAIPRLLLPVIWLGVSAVKPFIAWMLGDIGLQVFRRGRSTHPS